jgi:hypothetical protein
VLTFSVSGVPTVGVLHDGLGVDHSGQSAYTFTAAEMNGMTLTLPDDTGNQNFTLTVTAIATEQSNGSTASSPPGTIDVTIHNVPPTLSNLGATNTNEGSATTLTGKITDPGTDTFTVTVDWGDGTTSTFNNVQQGNFSYDHVYVDDNPTGTSSDPYTIHVTVTDDDGGSTAASTQITVSNVAPTITNIIAPTINEGQTANLTFTVGDVGTADTFAITVNWGDGSAPTVFNEPTAGTYTVSHLYVDNAPGNQPYQVSITAVDDDTGTTTVTTPLMVQDVAPTVALVSITPTELNEGNSATVTGTFSDPGVNDSFTVEVNWGDGSQPTTINLPAGSHDFTFTHLYVDDNPSSTSTDLNKVTVTVTDKDGLAGTNSTNIRVDNVPPTLTNFATTNLGSNGVLTISGKVTDPGKADVITLTIN